MIEFLSHHLKEKGVLDRFETIDLEIVSEFNLYNLIFAK